MTRCTCCCDNLSVLLWRRSSMPLFLPCQQCCPTCQYTEVCNQSSLSYDLLPELVDRLLVFPIVFAKATEVVHQAPVPPIVLNHLLHLIQGDGPTSLQPGLPRTVFSIQRVNLRQPRQEAAW